MVHYYKQPLAYNLQSPCPSLAWSYLTNLLHWFNPTLSLLPDCTSLNVAEEKHNYVDSSNFTRVSTASPLLLLLSNTIKFPSSPLLKQLFYIFFFFNISTSSPIPAFSWWPYCFTNTSKQKSTASSHCHFYTLSCDHILWVLSCYNGWNVHVHEPKATSSTCIKIFLLLLPTLEQLSALWFLLIAGGSLPEACCYFPIWKKNAFLISFPPPVSFPFLCDPLQENASKSINPLVHSNLRKEWMLTNKCRRNDRKSVFCNEWYNNLTQARIIKECQWRELNCWEIDNPTH